ncbi:DEAD/DEAH box helicase [Shigella boydii]
MLEGRDLMASAQPGTGKQRALRCRVATPDHSPAARQGRRPVCVRSLLPRPGTAGTDWRNVRDYSKYLNIRSLVVFGGARINPQMMKLRGGVDVLVATPGRLLDLNIRM